MGKSLILGFFDGVHIAHRAVIKSAVDFARQNGAEAALVTFKDSPALYFLGEAEYIFPREDSLQKISELGVNDAIELSFCKIAQKTAEEYLDFLYENFSPISISTGFNHTFGYEKSGNPDFLKKNQEKYNYKYFCTEPQLYKNEIVSSTFIKEKIRNGQVEEANELLQDNFYIKGTVIRGAQIGRTIGFPTANIEYPERIVKLPFGVYSAKACGKKAVLNWGMKPTVNNIKKPLAEVHIAGFDGDLYGRDIKIEVLKKIRDEQKFNNLEELKLQIKRDIENA